MPTTYYLDTTIQLSKLFAPSVIRHTIQQRIKEHPCVVASYARMEYLRWLEPAVAVHQLLQEEIAQPNGYRLEPNLAYRRGAMPCHIIDFLQGHRNALQELAVAMREAYPPIADACQRVLKNPTDAQGNTCKTLGDVIIALQTPTDAILWTTDASFDLICPTLGISHLRERLTVQ